jgi:hypothetical protein
MTARPLWSKRAWLGHSSPLFVSAVQSLVRASTGLATAGWELSVRISPQGVNCQRLLVGWNTVGVASSRLLALPDELGMHEELAQIWKQQGPQASQVLLAAEVSTAPDGMQVRNDSVVDRRAYLQFSSNDAQDTLVLRGFKWREDQPQTWRQTDYHRVLLDLVQTQVAVQHAALDDQRSPSLCQAYAAAADVLANVKTELERRGQAMSHVPFELLVATESVAGASTPRSSLCCRLYDVDVDVRVASTAVQTLLQAWGHASQGAAISNLLTHRPLGWLAVGQDRQGQPFFTLYAQASIHDAWQWIASGAGL